MAAADQLAAAAGRLMENDAAGPAMRPPRRRGFGASLRARRFSAFLRRPAEDPRARVPAA